MLKETSVVAPALVLEKKRRKNEDEKKNKSTSKRLFVPFCFFIGFSTSSILSKKISELSIFSVERLNQKASQDSRRLKKHCLLNLQESRAQQICHKALLFAADMSYKFV